MFIEIHGVQFENQGAALMLHAILEKIRSEMPDSRVVLAPGYGRPFYRRAQVGAYQKLWFSAFGLQVGNQVGAFIPRKIRRLYGMVRHSELDAILDASGFAYGDQWGPSRSEQMARAARKLKKHGGKIVLMPQAMGPFSTRRIQRAFGEALEMADLVFPRDRLSYEYVCDLVGEDDRIIQSPDITLIIKGKESRKSAQFSGKFAIIPNHKMLQLPNVETRVEYPRFMSRCIEILQELGEFPYFLVHEGNRDLQVAHMTNGMLSQPIEITVEKDPMKTKAIIGRSKGVISSRYHGLVSALSQGVPALGTSWSHKYETLMQEFGCPDELLDISYDDRAIRSAIEKTVDSSSREALLRSIDAEGSAQRRRVETMWTTIFDMLR